MKSGGSKIWAITQKLNGKQSKNVFHITHKQNTYKKLETLKQKKRNRF